MSRRNAGCFMTGGVMKCSGKETVLKHFMTPPVMKCSGKKLVLKYFMTLWSGPTQFANAHCSGIMS